MTCAKQLLVLVGVLILHGAAGAAPVTVTATADTFVDSAQPDSNFGGAGAMQLTAAGNSKGQLISLIKFDPTAITTAFNSEYGAGDWTPSSITLDLGTNFGTQGATPNNPIFATIEAGEFDINLMNNTSWVEGTGNPGAPTTDGLTYNELPTYTSTVLDVSLGMFSWTAAGNGTYTFNLGSNSALESAITNDKVISLEFLAADSNVSFLFNTRSYGTVSYQDMLTVNVSIPEPPPGSLLALGGLTLLGRAIWARRRV